MVENKNNVLPYLSNIGLMMTYKCTIACPHCIVKAGPSRKEEMSVKDALNWITQIVDYKNGLIKGISLTGGEPFYNYESLQIISNFASKKGIIVSVVTNAFWANTIKEAILKLTNLPGIKMISFSTDINHQKFLPLENIKNGIEAAKNFNIQYNVAITTDNESDEEYLKILNEIKRFCGEDDIQLAITMPVGRAEKHSNKFNFNVTTEPDQSACEMASFPIIFPNSDVIACIGPPITLGREHPLYLGNLKEKSLKEILDDSQKNIALHAIRVFGPSVLVKLLNKNGYKSDLPNKYIDGVPCDVCLQLFSNQNINQAIIEVISSSEFKLKVAYGRYYYLQESEMLEEKFYK